MASMTIRRRLVIGVLVILAVLIAAVGSAEIVVLRHVLYQRTAQGLIDELDLSSPVPSRPPPTPPGLMPIGPGTIPFPTAPTASSTSLSRTTGSCAGVGSGILRPHRAGGGGQMGPPGAEGGQPGARGAASLAKSLAAKGIASAIAGPEGTLVACAPAERSGNQTGFSVPSSVLARLSEGNGYVTVTSQGHHLLAISRPFGADTAILVTDLGGDDTAVRVVLVVTLLSGLVALLAAGALSGPLLRSGLTPLRKIAQTADAIAGGDLDQRADLVRSTDEVGQLGTAFDRMVDRLQSSLVERDALVEQLRLQEQTTRRFVSDASHELRTPLTAILGSAQVLRLGAASDPDDLSESLGHIQAQAERMSRLVDDLLLLSRQDAGQPDVVKVALDLAALVESQHRQWETLAGDHPVRIATEPAWVTADPDALIRACANLIENAAKYSPAGSLITVQVVASDGGAELSVSDRGPGIPVQERGRVFDRFYRGDPARTRATGGTGLGLAIVAGIITDHQGRVRVEDNPGGGTRMVLDLPSASVGRAIP